MNIFFRIVLLIFLGLSLTWFVLNKFFVQEGLPEIIFEPSHDLDAVVTIDPGDGSIGFGFFISEEGQVLTNYHTLSSWIEDRSNSDVIQIQSFDGKNWNAYLVKSDASLDLVLLQTDLKGDPVHFLNLAQQNPQQNEEAYFMSTPVQTLNLENWSKKSISGSTQEYTQTLDGVISLSGIFELGQSGIPLLNSQGEVLGMLSLVSKDQKEAAFIPWDALLTFVRK